MTHPPIAKGKLRGVLLVAALLSAGASVARAAPASPDPREVALLDRVTWGVNGADARAIASLGADRWLDRQLHPPRQDRLPPRVQAEIDALTYVRTPMPDLVLAVQAQQKAANALTDPAQKKAAQDVYNKEMSDTAGQAAARSILRDIYSPDQLKEVMTWFWFNHFNVHQYKSNVRLMVGDYEDRAIRPRALGRFRDLLEATLRHPAMLRYLDNADNAAGKINENYAREIMELHTMGVGSGYTQGDVQELARILTGVGIDTNPKPPGLPPELRGQLIRDGIFEFNPKRHDYGDKVFLGHHIRGSGFGEVEEALDILAREPATARHVSRQLAVYFVSDNPPAGLVDRMSQTFLSSKGDIARVLAVMFRSPEFKASLGSKFKDPAHYVLSSVRLAYDDRVVPNPGQVQGWLGRLGEGLYNHETPDGYSMAAAAWNGPGQMETRFELARQIGGGGGGLFKVDFPTLPVAAGPPLVERAVDDDGIAPTLAPATRAALAKATSVPEWNTLFLASPDFMRR